ncbi:MAG: ABC transporter permease [Fusicatenibacter sp.]|nr:ABC transporter permease [Fusicatenibacter sp.]
MKAKKKSKNITLILGGCIFAGMLLFLLVGLVGTPYDPDAMNGGLKFAAPSLSHPFGCDHFGRDVFSRVLEGTGTTFFVAAATLLLGGGIGILIGAFTGYFGGWIDEVLMRVNDAIVSFPNILLALVLISIFGPGKYNVILALGIVFIPSFARMTRSEFLSQKEMDYVKSARLMGVSHLRIIFVHILPNTIPTLLSMAAIGFNNAVLAEAGMSFLGIGVQPPDASLGRMLSEAQAYLMTAPWCAIFPGLAVILLALGVSLLGDGIQQKGGV